MKLTPAEQEVLTLLTEEYLTAKQITLRRKTSKVATYKLIRKLKDKGALSIGLQKVNFSGGGSKPFNQIRIHAQQFIIKILYKDYKYKQLLKKSNQIELDGNTINLWEKSIEIYSNQSFYGNDISQALSKSVSYWNRLITRLEHDTKTILKKPRSQNIKLVRIHIAETNNEVAKDIDNKGERYFQIYTREDGKLWFLIDNSFNLHEAEAVHSKTAREDMEKVTDVFNDIRDNPSYLPSETKGMLDRLVKASSNMVNVSNNMLQYAIKTNHNVDWLAENIKSHGPAWLGMAKEAGNIRKEVSRLSGILSQKKITEY